MVQKRIRADKFLIRACFTRFPERDISQTALLRREKKIVAPLFLESVRQLKLF
jgi:hypothetical protein